MKHLIIFVNVNIGWRTAVLTLKFRSNSTEPEQMLNKKYRMFTGEHKYMMENRILVIKWDKFEDVSIFDFDEIRERFTHQV